jgi:hypothetical protein
MRPLRMVGVTVLAVAAVAATGVASAAAAPPEWGRCEAAVGGKTGEYKNAKCTAPAGGTGLFNWAPEPTGKAKFATVGEKVGLETTGKRRIICGESVSDGSYTGPKTATVTLMLVGCNLEGTATRCQTNPAKEGEIEASLEAELGFITGGSRPVVGVALKPKAPSTVWAAFSCVKLPETPVLSGVIEGSVIGRIKPLNRMTAEYAEIYSAAAGVQAVQQFEGGAKDTLTVKLLEGLTTTTEEIGLRQRVALENEGLETTEIKAK